MNSPRLQADDQAELFSALPALPDGFIYQREFLTQPDERALMSTIQDLTLEQAPYKEWQARRRIVSYGARYDFSHYQLLPAPAIPSLLYPLRQRIGAWSGLPAESFQHATITEYGLGTPLGWHRDIPHFETIVGVSLAGMARMRLRPYPPQRGQRSVLSIAIEPRSIYILQGAVRWDWQHAISPTKELRYSITFRTRRG
jgi:alkylated DNA repair dioxygenase AlkB